MKWSNLRSFKCPNCEWILHNKSDDFYKCTGCHYKIYKEVFDNIIFSMTKPRTKLASEEDNLEELNNLGRQPVPEGFSEENDE